MAVEKSDREESRLFCVDEYDRPLAPQPRCRCHADPVLTHRTVHVMVLDGGNRILSQKRSLAKDIQPGKWDTAVGGHVEPGEDSDAAAIREFREELGLQSPGMTFLYEYLWVSDLESERVRTYLARCEGPFRFDPDEIDDLNFFSLDQLQKMDIENGLTPNFRFEIHLYRKYVSGAKPKIPDYPVRQICLCRRCDRLTEYRKNLPPVSGFRKFPYWNRPVPGFGDPAARFLIVGLAPGAHGANRTGRPFTGDAAGDLLIGSLYSLGLCSRPVPVCRGDGLTLRDVFITNAVKCVPPDNRPSALEMDNCREYLAAELDVLGETRSILALGGTAFEAVRKTVNAHFDTQTTRWKFRHGEHRRIPGSDLIVTACYHPSRRNISTGLLTPEGFKNVLKKAYRLVEPSR
ncbi:NUDIX domain-containing protein [bacterium]|nr:NUDIX domain-containing protein [candidate division CSSED10-310 bacterium]